MNDPSLCIHAVSKPSVLSPISQSPKPFFARLVVAFVSLISLASATPASAQATNFGSVNVCPLGKTTPAPCSANQTITFSIPAETTISSIAIVATGIPDLDFKAEADDSSATLCKAQKYSTAATCTVDVTFTPLAAGARRGAVELLNGSGAVISTTYIYGSGSAPQLAFDPASIVSISTAFPLGGFVNAIDAANNIYVVTSEDPTVEKILASGGYKTIETINPAITPLAIDGAGNFFGFKFVQEGTLSALFEATAASGYQTSKELASGVNDLEALAVDSSGNIFVTQYNNSVVIEFLAAGGYTTTKTLSKEVTEPGSIAVDAAGNLFVGEYGSSGAGDIKEILAAGGYTTVKLLAGGAALSPFTVALDAAGNVYAFNINTGLLSELLAATGYNTVDTLSTAVNLAGVAVDPSGDLFFTNRFGGQEGSGVYNYTTTESLRSQPPPALAFANTAVGGTSSDSPQSVQFQNVGTALLTGTGDLSDDANFTVVPGSGTVPDCAAATLSLVAGSACDLSFDFTPQSSGLLSSLLTLTDNSGNVTDATQSLSLSGLGASTTAVAKVSAAILNFGSIAYPGSATQTLTITNTGTGTLAIVPSSNGRGAVVTGNTCGAGIGAGKSCALQVEFAPVHLGLNTNTLTIGTNTATNPTVAVRGTATGAGSLTTLVQFGTIFGKGTKTEPITVTNYGVPGAVTVAIESGTTPFSVVSNGCTTGITSGKSCTIEVEYAPTTGGTVIGYLGLVPSTGPKQIIGLQGSQD